MKYPSIHEHLRRTACRSKPQGMELRSIDDALSKHGLAKTNVNELKVFPTFVRCMICPNPTSRIEIIKDYPNIT